ncbi:MAG: type pilus assembly protein PilC [Patescibacteria group bacterium]|nr:Type secretion system family protein [Patescibacteria group bacterium]MDQ5970355.1 type pilus assembly protein PilC [Patescibacteria group bacterium]
MDSELMSGIVEAPGESEAAELLSERGLVVLSLVTSHQKAFKGININIGGVSQKDLVIFSRQLAVMISATIPIVQSLRILSQQTNNPVFTEKVVEMANDVDGGMKLSDAMAKHYKIFSNFFVAMIKSGETSGRLEEVLEYLADQMEKDYDLVARIKGAMIYPALILTALVGVSILMMVYILPKMTPMLQETGAELPMVTLWLIAISDFMVKYWPFLLLIILVLIGIFVFWTKSKSGKTMWDSVKIRMPIFGNLFKKIYLVRFTRSLHTLIKGGVPIASALRITAEVVDNKAYSDLIMRTVAEVEAGNSISTLFAKSPLMPKMLSQMMIVGEKTGRIDNILEKLSDFYTREINNLVSNLTVLIEPLILIIMGVGVAGIVAAIMLPMYKVAQTIN